MSVVRPKQVPENKKVFNFAESTEKVPQKIVGFSGKIGAGKTSCSNFLHAMVFTHVLQNTPYAYVSETGKLMVQDSNNFVGEVDIHLRTPEAIHWLQTNIWGIIRNYSFAEPLKEMAIKMFGLSFENVYGTQEQKAAPTHLSWEDMPVLVKPNDGIIKYKSGPMSGRQFLEYLGTNVMRQINPDCFSNAIKNLITTPDPYYGLTHICVVDDLRFPGELKAIKDIGGIVVRLTKKTEEAAKNNHESNVALDGKENLFDYVIDNQNMTMEESFGELMGLLYKENWFQEVTS